MGSNPATRTKSPESAFAESGLFCLYEARLEDLNATRTSIAGGGSMTENIDKVGGNGTGAFAKEVIDIYIGKQA